MADNDQDNDEYKFAELDSMENDPLGDSDPELNPGFSSEQGPAPEKKDIRRNALIAVGLIIFVMVMYKIIGSMFFSGKKDVMAEKTTIPPLTQAQSQPVKPVEVAPVVVEPQQPVVPVNNASTDELKKEVAALEISQQSVRADVSSLSSQVSTVNSNLNTLSEQITKLNEVVNNLSNQVAQQSAELNSLIARAKPKKVKAASRLYIQPIAYNIQAIIPGRAWLIGSNGSTLTVREGIKINGYGTVRLIDSLQGRVLTSSGRIIRFGQDDS